LVQLHPSAGWRLSAACGAVAWPDGQRWLGRPEEGERPQVGRLGDVKWRSEVARLHALRRAARGHGMVAAALLGAGGGKRCTGGPDRVERPSGVGRFQGKGARATRRMQAEM
jgi:hypothetical protein